MATISKAEAVQPAARSRKSERTMVFSSADGLLSGKSSRLRLLAAVALGLLSVIPGGGAATASAVVTPFSFAVTETFADAPSECMP